MYSVCVVMENDLSTSFHHKCDDVTHNIFYKSVPHHTPVHMHAWQAERRIWLNVSAGETFSHEENVCYLQCQRRRWSASWGLTSTHSLSRWTHYLAKPQPHPQVRSHRTISTSPMIRLNCCLNGGVGIKLPCQSWLTVVVMNFMEKCTRLSFERSPLNFSGFYRKTN